MKTFYWEDGKKFVTCVAEDLDQAKYLAMLAKVKFSDKVGESVTPCVVVTDITGVRETFEVVTDKYEEVLL